MLPSAESIQIILPVAAVLSLLLTFKRTIYGVIAYFIILNAKLGDMYPALGAIRFELVAAVIVMLSIFLHGKGMVNVFPGSNSLNKPFWVLFTVGMLSVIQAVDVSVSWENGGYNLFKLAIFYVMVVASINDAGDLKRMLWAFILIVGWTSYDPISNFLHGVVSTHAYGTVATGRFGAAAGHVGLANTLNQGIPLTYYFTFCSKDPKAKIILYAILGLAIVAIVLSKSRGGFVGLLVIVMGVTYLSKEKGKTIAISIPLLVIVAVLTGQEYLTRMSTISDGIHGSRSAGDRYMGLLNGISMMIKRPLLGVGIGCYAEARLQYFRYYFYAHNLYGELFGELGLASAAWFFWIYALFRKSRELKQRVDGDPNSQQLLYYVLCGVQLGLFVRLVLGNFSHCAFIWFWFLMAALVIAIENILVNENSARARIEGVR